MRTAMGLLWYLIGGYGVPVVQPCDLLPSPPTVCERCGNDNIRTRDMTPEERATFAEEYDCPIAMWHCITCGRNWVTVPVVPPDEDPDLIWEEDR